MKKRKLLIALLTLVFATTTAVAVASCDNSAGGDPTQIEQIYEQYVLHAEADGEQPLSYEEWLASIKGEKGEDGETGKSAYQIWLDNGNTGTQADFLAWLKGEKGEDGETGKSAYQIWLDNGNTGTETDFLNWLKGEKGDDGDAGVGIEKVEVDANGDLKITFTDGTTQTVEMPMQGNIETLQYQKMIGKEEYRVVGLGTVSDCEIVIPATYRGLPVTEIAQTAFEYNDGLTSVTISDSVTSIGGYAFYGCSSLTEVVIPDSVTSIGGGAFSECSSLTEIVIPDSVTSIGNSAFSDCESLTEIVIPDSVTSIGDYAFYRCSSLTEIVIPDSVTSIGYSAFYGCSSLMEIVIPDSVTSIGDRVFYGCSSLTIYCEVESQPSGWSSLWNYSDRPVVWGYKKNEGADDITWEIG